MDTRGINKLFEQLLIIHKRFLTKLSPEQNIVYGFATYTIVGWLLLCMPFFRKQEVHVLDNLFTAASAISTTGLSTVSIFDSYNLLGQFIIILLVQLGGIGYMTFSSFIVLSRHQELTHQHKKILIAEFPMPKDFELKDFLKSVILFTAIVELIGAICLYIVFRNAGVETKFAIWSSIFHSISAFCTAGLGLYNDSFESFAGNNSLNAIISALSILGSLG
ncbi:MAG: hypothetical protein LLG05_15830, partial [Porphyromonadaceae bacterium]|nr:hypothetical protein [Porphyromonadaceae bacterium]